jgi:hypothetical protein
LREWPSGVELFVLDGGLADERGRYERGAWIRLPAGDSLALSSEPGCTLYVKEGAVAWLRSEPEDRE